jgi:aconitate decarboxylase
MHLQHALGVAATQVVGMQEFFDSNMKSFYIGRAAQSGMLAALLAKSGYTSSLQRHTVELRVNLETIILMGKRDPQTGLEGKFSIYHAAAVALLYGEATPSQFTVDVVKNSTVIGMCKKVNVTVDDVASKAKAYVV